MTTTLTITSGQTSFTAQNYTILPSPGTPVPDNIAPLILAAAQYAGVILSSSAGTGVITVPSRRFNRSGVGPPVAGEGSWLLGDEVVDSTGAEWECSSPGNPGTWTTQSGTFGPGGAPDWAATTAYKANQIVLYGGVLYRANADFTSASSFDATKWTGLGLVPVNDGVQKLILGYNDTTQQLYFDPTGPPDADRTTYRVSDDGHLYVYKGNTPIEVLTQANLTAYEATLLAGLQASTDGLYLSQAAGSGKTQGASLSYVQKVEQRLRHVVGTVFCGDSETNLLYPNRLMWHDLLTYLSNGYLRHRGKFALGGITAETWQSTFLPQVLAMSPAPQTAVIVLGSNNITQAGFSVSSTVATLTAIYDSLVAAGIRPIGGLIPPHGTTAYTNNARMLNAALLEVFASRGMHWVDLFAPLVDPATGSMIGPYDSGDATHPNTFGQTAIATYNLARTNFLAGFRTADGTPRLTRALSDPANLLGDFGAFTALQSSGANSGLPNGWTSGAAFSAVELITDAALPVGNWVRLHKTTASGTSPHTLFPVTGLTVSGGDVISVAFKYRLNFLTTVPTSPAATPDAGLRATALFSGGAGSSTILFGACPGTHAGVAYYETTAPTGATSLKLEFRLVGAVSDDTSYVDLAQVTVQNKTSLGVAATTPVVNA